ncbi:hypothetical protein AGLY_013132, partial [Aphis glycines]
SINYLDLEFRLLFVLFLFLVSNSISGSDDSNTSGLEPLLLIFQTLLQIFPNSDPPKDTDSIINPFTHFKTSSAHLENIILILFVTFEDDEQLLICISHKIITNIKYPFSSKVKLRRFKVSADIMRILWVDFICDPRCIVKLSSISYKDILEMFLPNRRIQSINPLHFFYCFHNPFSIPSALFLFQSINNVWSSKCFNAKALISSSVLCNLSKFSTHDILDCLGITIFNMKNSIQRRSRMS